MKPVNGQVMINECPSKSKLFRFCEKKIDQWLESHGSPAEPAEFSVSFTSGDGADSDLEYGGDEAKQISCVTEIHLGSVTLRGCDVDVDTQAAFLHSLKRLHTAQQASI